MSTRPQRGWMMLNSSFDTDKERLLALLFQNAFRYDRKPIFKLTSGKASHFYMDCKKVSLSPEGAFLIGRLFFDWIKGMPVDAVGGMTLGADPIATAISLISFIQNRPIPAFIVRKAPKGHGSLQQIEGTLGEDSQVVIVEDVVTSGGSTLQTIDVLKKAGHRPLAVMAIIDRQEGGAEKIAEEGIRFESLYTLQDFLKLRDCSS